MIFQRVILLILGLGLVGAFVDEVWTFVWTGYWAQGGGRLLFLGPLGAVALRFSVRSLLRLRDRDVRLGADEDGVRWVYVSGENRAGWHSLDRFEADARTRSVLDASLDRTRPRPP
jgi:hypothetical protein